MNTRTLLPFVALLSACWPQEDGGTDTEDPTLVITSAGSSGTASSTTTTEGDDTSTGGGTTTTSDGSTSSIETTTGSPTTSDGTTTDATTDATTTVATGESSSSTTSEDPYCGDGVQDTSFEEGEECDGEDVPEVDWHDRNCHFMHYWDEFFEGFRRYYTSTPYMAFVCLPDCTTSPEGCRYCGDGILTQDDPSVAIMLWEPCDTKLPELNPTCADLGYSMPGQAACTKKEKMVGNFFFAVCVVDETPCLGGAHVDLTPQG